jgi:hypothetical protein
MGPHHKNESGTSGDMVVDGDTGETTVATSMDVNKVLSNQGKCTHSMISSDSSVQPLTQLSPHSVLSSVLSAGVSNMGGSSVGFPDMAASDMGGSGMGGSNAGGSGVGGSGADGSTVAQKTVPMFCYFKEVGSQHNTIILSYFVKIVYNNVPS